MIIFKERSYKFEKQSHFEKADRHPLLREIKSTNAVKGLNKTVSVTVTKSSYIDPLSSNSTEMMKDPLLSTNINDSKLEVIASNMETWSSKRISILTTYTTSEKLSIISSFLTKKPDDNVRVLNKPTSTIMDKVKNKLEQLDQFDEEVRETSNLSVQQFAEKIHELQNALKASWRDGQRVKALQIIIQSTKLLSEANVIQFFPSKFVLVTDMVDNFASYVYDRLKAKSAITQRGSKVPIELPSNFKESQVPELAKETARNWFYKVASIRELVARLYIEAALLPCYKFFDFHMISSSLTRLMKMTRGIGNPLLATYARAYIAKIGISLDPGQKDYLQLGFRDILESLSRLTNSPDYSKLSINDESDKHIPYLKLFVPAVDWTLQCLCNGVSNSKIDEIVSKIEDAQNPLLVHSLLNSVATTYIENRPFYFAQMIASLPESTYPKYAMYKQLGACVSLSFGLGPGKALELLKYVWKFIAKLSEPSQFIECFDAWAEFLTKNFNSSQVCRYLGHINKEMAFANLHVEFSNQLLSILNKVLSSKCDFESLFSSTEFMQYIAMFDKEFVLIEARQMVLDSFFNDEKSASLSDPVLIQTCIRMLKEMHESLNSMSVVDNRRTVTRLILTLIDRVKFEGRNVEQELDLLTQFRSTFGSIEKVTFNIVERVNSLAMRVRSLRPNHEHNSGSASFVRGCMAFSYITIPSIEDPSLVIRLYTSTAQVALVNGCLGQAESCIKESVYLLSRLDNDSKINDRILDAAVVVDLASCLASTLLMCPDITSVLVADNQNQNQQILYLLKGLINAIHICPILKTDNIATHKSILKGELYIKIIYLLSAFSQSQYLYSAGKTDANDKIYGCSDSFLIVISDIFKIVVSKIRLLNSPKIDQLLQETLVTILNLSSNIQDVLDKDWLSENGIAY